MISAALARADEAALNRELTKLEAVVQDGKNPTNRDITLIVDAVERVFLKQPDPQKIGALIRLLKLSIGLLNLRDPSVPLDGTRPAWPAFEWHKYNEKPLFEGASPEGIDNPDTKAAYYKYLADRDDIYSRATKNKLIMENVDKVIKSLETFIQSASNKKSMLNAAATCLSAKDVPDAAANYVRSHLLKTAVDSGANIPKQQPGIKKPDLRSPAPKNS